MINWVKINRPWLWENDSHTAIFIMDMVIAINQLNPQFLGCHYYVWCFLSIVKDVNALVSMILVSFLLMFHLNCIKYCAGTLQIQL